jgi:hypothetical protein
MASSWIKMRVDLDTDPRVITMADLLVQSAASYVLSPSARDLLGVSPTVTRDVMRDVTLAALYRIWRDANRHTCNGVFHHSTLAHLDLMAGVTGFGRAMAAVGWAIEDTNEHTVTLPNFMEMNSPQKGGGSSNADRQKRWRERRKAVTHNDKRNVTPPVTDNTDIETETETEVLTPPPLEQARPKPANFPESEAKARDIAVAIGVDPAFAAVVWLELDATGGTNDKGHPVTNFASYVKMRSTYRDSKHAERKHRDTRPLTGEATGTLTEGERKALYARWMGAKGEASAIRRRTFTDDAARETAAKRLHELERTITELETKHDFTSK